MIGEKSANHFSSVWFLELLLETLVIFTSSHISDLTDSIIWCFSLHTFFSFMLLLPSEFSKDFILSFSGGRALLLST